MNKVYRQLKQIIKKFIPKSLFNYTINFYHLIEAFVANLRYGFPAKNLKVIGITQDYNRFYDTQNAN